MLFENIGLECTDIEVKKMREALNHNANLDFVGLYEYEISNVDLKSEYKY